MPDPFGPIRPMRSPSETVNETFWNRGVLPYRFESPCALIIGGKFFGVLLQTVYPRRVRGAKSGAVNTAANQRFRTIFGAPAEMQRGLKPIAAVSEPPARITDGDRRSQRPPERKYHIGAEAQDCERNPKYLPLHTAILDASALMMSRRRANMFQIQTPAVTAVARIPKRSRHDP